MPSLDDKDLTLSRMKDGQKRVRVFHWRGNEESNAVSPERAKLKKAA